MTDFCHLCDMAFALNGESVAQDVCEICFGREILRVCPYCDCHECWCDIDDDWWDCWDDDVQLIEDPDDALHGSRFRTALTGRLVA